MSKGDTFENDLLKLIFQGVAITGLADNAASSPITNLYVSLHTADPGESGTQTTNEVGYTGYARQAVARSTAGWAIAANVISPVADITFPASTAGTGTATHFAIGTAASGTGKVLYKGPLTTPPSIAAGSQPKITAANTTVTED